MGSSISVLVLGSGCLGTRVRALVHDAVGGVSRGSVALVLLLRVFFVKYLLSSGVEEWRCACARSCVAPASELWFLGASLPSNRICGGGAGSGLPGPARLDSSLLQSWCLGLGPGCLVCRLPSVSLPWVGSDWWFWVSVSASLEMASLFFRNSGRSFLGNLSLRLRLRLIPSLPRAPCFFMPGVCRKRGWECWSGSSSTSLRGS